MLIWLTSYHFGLFFEKIGLPKALGMLIGGTLLQNLPSASGCALLEDDALLLHLRWLPDAPPGAPTPPGMHCRMVRVPAALLPELSDSWEHVAAASDRRAER